MITDIKAQVQEALRLLSGQCDGASSRDNVGFNGYDASNGRRLASLPDLTPSQVLNAAKMLQKYHNQIEVPSLQAAKRYFAVNFNAVTVEADNNDYAGEQMEEETYTENEQQEEKPVPQIETTQPEIILSAEQQALLKVMETTRQHLFITGRAGTGKSVLLRHFRENTKKRIVVAAPTGIAALNVRGQTIHSLFRLPPQFHRKGSLAPNSKICSVLRRIDTIVIDEISMVRADLLDAIDERLREAHKNDLPFGGVQIIMFGDCYQLPPVVEEGLLPYFEHSYGGYFFFHADVWKKTAFKIYELAQVFRQKDPVFKEVLNAVRDGSATDEQIAQLNARCGVSIPKDGTITLATTNSLVTAINQLRLDHLPGQAFEYRASITGEMKRGTFPTEEVIQLKVGAQVVLLQNDKDRRWVNGTVATISELKKDAITVKVEGIDYGLEKTTWEEIRYEYDPSAGKVKEEVTSSFTQYPIRLAWAMTIHKSQGQTYESCCLDLTVATFAPGQLYVALSRCTSMEGLYLKMPVARKHIIVEPKVAVFMAGREETIEVIEETQYLAEEAVAIVEEAQELAEAIAPTSNTSFASFLDMAIQDAAQRGFTVQAIIDAPLAQPTHLEASETPQMAYPKVTDKPRGEKAVRAKKADELPTMVKVGYKFEEDTVSFLKDLTEQVSGLNKSKWIEDMIRATPEYQEWLKKQGQ